MDNKQMKFPVAAILFIPLSFMYLMGFIPSVINRDVFYITVNLICIAACVLQTISLFMKRRGVLMIIGTAFLILYVVFSTCSVIVETINNISSMSAPHTAYNIAMSFCGLLSIVLWVMILFTIPALTEKFGKTLLRIAQKVWFIPVLLLFVIDCSLAIGLVAAQSISVELTYIEWFAQLIILIHTLTITVFEYLPWFFMLLWVRNPYRKQAAQPVQPMEPVQPIQPVEPIEPVQPIESAEPAQSEETIQQ